MKWVGILYINEYIYFNGFYFANSFEQLFNKFFIANDKLPTWVLIFNKQPHNNQRILSDFENQLSGLCTFIHYDRKGPFIYCLKDKKNYCIAIIVGILMSLFLMMIIWRHHLTISNKIIYPITLSDEYERTMSRFADICEHQQCLAELAIFPNQIMVKLKTLDQEPSLTQIGCQKLDGKMKVFRCIDH